MTDIPSSMYTNVISKPKCNHALFKSWSVHHFLNPKVKITFTKYVFGNEHAKFLKTQIFYNPTGVSRIASLSGPTATS